MVSFSLSIFFPVSLSMSVLTPVPFSVPLSLAWTLLLVLPSRLVSTPSRPLFLLPLSSSSPVISVLILRSFPRAPCLLTSGLLRPLQGVFLITRVLFLLLHPHSRSGGRVRLRRLLFLFRFLLLFFLLLLLFLLFFFICCGRSHHTTRVNSPHFSGKICVQIGLKAYTLPFFGFFNGKRYLPSDSDSDEDATVGAQPCSLRFLVMSSMSSESLGGR